MQTINITPDYANVERFMRQALAVGGLTRKGRAEFRKTHRELVAYLRSEEGRRLHPEWRDVERPAAE